MITDSLLKSKPLNHEEKICIIFIKTHNNTFCKNKLSLNVIVFIRQPLDFGYIAINTPSFTTTFFANCGLSAPYIPHIRKQRGLKRA